MNHKLDQLLTKARESKERKEEKERVAREKSLAMWKRLRTKLRGGKPSAKKYHIEDRHGFELPNSKRKNKFLAG